MAPLLARGDSPKAKDLVDTGNHHQAKRIVRIVAWLLAEDMLGGFHFNGRRYADEDLTIGCHVDRISLWPRICGLRFGAFGLPRADHLHGEGRPELGRSQDPRRTSEARLRGFRTIRGAVLATSGTAAIAAFNFFTVPTLKFKLLFGSTSVPLRLRSGFDHTHLGIVVRRRPDVQLVVASIVWHADCKLFATMWGGLQAAGPALVAILWRRDESRRGAGDCVPHNSWFGRMLGT
jgi:hypothetical protein